MSKPPAGERVENGDAGCRSRRNGKTIKAPGEARRPAPFPSPLPPEAAKTLALSMLRSSRRTPGPSALDDFAFAVPAPVALLKRGRQAGQDWVPAFAGMSGCIFRSPSPGWGGRTARVSLQSRTDRRIPPRMQRPFATPCYTGNNRAEFQGSEVISSRLDLRGSRL
jgi:hypothetical protein